MTSWNGFRKLPTLRLGKTQRQTPLNGGIKNGQVIDYKKKLVDILGNLKMVPNLDLQRVFDHLLANYLIAKEFLKWIGYISIYWRNKSKHKKIKKTK